MQNCAQAPRFVLPPGLIDFEQVTTGMNGFVPLFSIGLLCLGVAAGGQPAPGTAASRAILVEFATNAVLFEKNADQLTVQQVWPS